MCTALGASGRQWATAESAKSHACTDVLAGYGLRSGVHLQRTIDWAAESGRPASARSGDAPSLRCAAHFWPDPIRSLGAPCAAGKARTHESLQMMIAANRSTCALRGEFMRRTSRVVTSCWLSVAEPLGCAERGESATRRGCGLRGFMIEIEILFSAILTRIVSKWSLL